MSLSPRPRFAVEKLPPRVALRFECKCKLDASGPASLELSGELDRAACPEFERRLAEAQRASATVTLDLRRLTFMDSAGYATLVWAARALPPEGKLLLTGCAGQVGRLLDLLGLPEKVEMQAPPISPALGTAAGSSATSPGSEAAVGA